MNEKRITTDVFCWPHVDQIMHHILQKKKNSTENCICLLQFTKSNPVCVYRGKFVVLLHAVRCIDREHIWCNRTRLTASLVGRSWIPCLELAGDEVVVTADQLEGPLLQPFLDERVGLEVLEGHVDGFLFQGGALIFEGG